MIIIWINLGRVLWKPNIFAYHPPSKKDWNRSNISWFKYIYSLSQYNKNYIDASKEKATGRRVKEHAQKHQEDADDDNLFDLIDSMYNEE